MTSVEKDSGDRVVKGRGGAKTERSRGTFDAVQQPSSSEQVNAAKSIEGWIIFVTNVHEEAQEDDLHELFSEFGEIKNLHLNLDRRTCFVKGYALIEYGSFSDARKAVAEMNGMEFMDQVLSVDWAFMKGPIGDADHGGNKVAAKKRPRS
eukprot:RCo016335